MPWSEQTDKAAVGLTLTITLTITITVTITLIGAAPKVAVGGRERRGANSRRPSNPRPGTPALTLTSLTLMEP